MQIQQENENEICLSVKKDKNIRRGKYSQIKKVSGYL